jgi:hypothetical protein
MADSTGSQSTRDIVLSGKRRRLGEVVILPQAAKRELRQVPPQGLRRSHLASVTAASGAKPVKVSVSSRHPRRSARPHSVG